MPRWIQHPITHKLVPAHEYERPNIKTHFVQGDVESFVSPIDGSVLTDRKQIDEHCKRHNVVPSGEFNPEFYARKARERADFFEGRHSKAETLARKQEIYETTTRLERQNER